MNIYQKLEGKKKRKYQLKKKTKIQGKKKYSEKKK